MLFNIGNAMAFAGIPNGKDRGDVVAYLKANA
jgi:cytochrome c2